MLSRKEGRNYLILNQDSDIPVKINRNKLDKRLNRLKKALLTVQKELADTYDKDSDLYIILRDEVFDGYSTGELYDGKSGWIDDILYRISSVQETLESEDDEIPDKEDMITLDSLGYRNMYPQEARFWEKVIEDTEEKEITEEIILADRTKNPDAGHVRRIRTTLWKKTEYGRASTSITYKKLRIGKKLMKAIENTRSAMKRKE